MSDALNSSCMRSEAERRGVVNDYNQPSSIFLWRKKGANIFTTMPRKKNKHESIQCFVEWISNSLVNSKTLFKNWNPKKKWNVLIFFFRFFLGRSRIYLSVIWALRLLAQILHKTPCAFHCDWTRIEIRRWKIEKCPFRSFLFGEFQSSSFEEENLHVIAGTEWGEREAEKR